MSKNLSLSNCYRLGSKCHDFFRQTLLAINSTKNSNKLNKRGVMRFHFVVHSHFAQFFLVIFQTLIFTTLFFKFFGSFSAPSTCVLKDVILFKNSQFAFTVNQLILIWRSSMWESRFSRPSIYVVIPGICSSINLDPFWCFISSSVTGMHRLTMRHFLWPQVHLCGMEYWQNSFRGVVRATWRYHPRYKKTPFISDWVLLFFPMKPQGTNW